MLKARFAVVLIGILLPYLARLLAGVERLSQYLNADIRGWVFLQAFNAIAWGSIVAISFLYRRPLSLLAPSLLGFGYIAWAHYSLDLAADAQSALGIIFIPIYALVPIIGGGALGYVLDRRLHPAF